MRVSVDARPLDTPGVRQQGIGRYAQELLGPLHEVATERGGELVVLRRLRRPPARPAAAELLDQALMPFDLRRLHPSVHHSLSLYGTPLFSPVPLVVTMHDVVPLQSPSEYMRTGLVHRLLYRAVRRAAAIICDSQAGRDDLLAHLEVDEARVSVVPAAADERFRPTDAGAIRARLGLQGPYLLYVGGLADPRKDVAGLIEAFEEWSGSERRAETLVLAGATGPATRELEARAGERVLFAGFVPDSELPALLSGASCFVSASRYEGFGLPLLESIACGTPVAAYEAGAIPEAAGPGALLAPAGDGVELMRAAGRICDEPELAERLSEAGRRHARRFSWRRTAEQTWAAYERAAA